MANWSKSYTVSPCNITRLTLEINDDGLTPNLLGISDDNSGSDNVEVTFDAEVTGGELTTLDTTLAAHGGAEAPMQWCFCYTCGCTQGERALAALTQCPVCSGTAIQSAYHKDYLTATTDPTVDADITLGYCEGSKWLNVTTRKKFECFDNTDGAAVWKPTNIIRKDVGWSSELDTDLAVVTGKHRVPIMFADTPKSIIIKSIRAMVETVPTGAAIIVDVHKNGTTVFTTQGNRPTIAIDGHDSGEVTNMDVTALAKGDYLTLDIDQIGSTIAGQNLVITLECEIVP